MEYTFYRITHNDYPELDYIGSSKIIQRGKDYITIFVITKTIDIITHHFTDLSENRIYHLKI